MRHEDAVPARAAHAVVHGRAAGRALPVRRQRPVAAKADWLSPRRSGARSAHRDAGQCRAGRAQRAGRSRDCRDRSDGYGHCAGPRARDCRRRRKGARRQVESPRTAEPVRERQRRTERSDAAEQRRRVACAHAAARVRQSHAGAGGGEPRVGRASRAARSAGSDGDRDPDRAPARGRRRPLARVAGPAAHHRHGGAGRADRAGGPGGSRADRPHRRARPAGDGLQRTRRAPSRDAADAASVHGRRLARAAHARCRWCGPPRMSR